MVKRFGISRRVLAWPLALVMGSGLPVFSQQLQRPDAGSLQETQRQIPLLPRPGAPLIELPGPKPAAAAEGTVRLVPAAFRFTGNTVFDGETLSALLAGHVNQPSSLARLTEAAGLVRQYYRSRGYLLTEAYLPEQAFQATGGTVTIAVIEARIGKVVVQVEGEHGSSSFARRVANANLVPGTLITEYLLDKPVLLLRDLAGVDASATVQPGDSPGQADVVMNIRSEGRQANASASIDHFGARAAGSAHATGHLNVSNLLGRGDLLSLRTQLSDASRSSLYRLAYAVPVGAQGTQLTLSAARTDYALGKQFAALGATGKADILGVSLTRPLVRSRENNLYGLFSLEHKKFADLIATPANESQRRIATARLGLLGNFVDEAAGAGGSSSYAVTVTRGRLAMDAASQGFDQGVGGLQTGGSFSKLNLEFQRAQILANRSSLHVNVQAQLASKNLASAEKMSLGGPTGVRAYPVGEGIGDAGLLVNLEYRYQLPAPVALAGQPVSLAAFYDYGTVKFNQDAMTMAGPNRLALGAVGVGALAGRINNFLITTYLAWRTTPGGPSTGDPDRSPRAWVSAQKWF
jgi:hemolysin activation/secretion protein